MKAIKSQSGQGNEKDKAQSEISAYKKINRLLKKHSMIEHVDQMNNNSQLLRNLKNKHDGL